ncbi:putative bifunctional diguanylate cyclase/phosphodiesterase [Leucothrix arctica]|uniref:GGDEF-domain containing protein n=1 Tax=Leucothrix arctica TaxID=1481894 RepID=A0A317C4A6_9GAMM|nr:GGDEF domain-containing phosphodiesterase [Leucothrix arctica]PWQ93109.1 hypothetical protein DKT75_20690 [Leucothrix arctica]
MLTRNLTYSEQRLVKTIRFTQLAMMLVVLNYIFESVMSSTAILTPNFIVMVSATLLLERSVRLVYEKKQHQAFSSFLAAITFALFVAMAFRGGLHSAGIVGIPVVILFGVLYGRWQDVLWLLACVLVFIVLLAQPFVIALLPSAEVTGTVVHQLPIVLLVICVGGYISWAIGSDMRQAFRTLHAETINLLDSKESISRLSKTDFLTGLVNAKQGCVDYKALLAGLNKEQRVCFYFIDLDGFKEVNDLFDHKAGDELLVLVAERLRQAVEETAYVCRLSGDEFIIFFVANRDSEVIEFAEKILDTVSQPHNLFGASAQITASIGIATTRRHAFSDIRKKASMAMYQSKRQGKGRYYLYTDALEAQYMQRIYILQGLKNGVKEGLFELHFQPKVDLDTRQITGMEALIRWTKGNSRNYTPDEFMSVIESTDLVHEIGSWVIKEACIACKKWHEAGHILPVAVNVSALQLLRPNFAKSVLQVLSSLGLDARYLEIELTERFLVEKNDAVEKQLESLRLAGVSLAIDDFGTGYSNVSYLMNLEANVLKLDKSFVDSLHTNASMQSVAKAIIEIARAGQMKVVAEGLETLADIKAVTELGCDAGQGYYWSKPVNQQQAMALLDGEMCA